MLNRPLVFCRSWKMVGTSTRCMPCWTRWCTSPGSLRLQRPKLPWCALAHPALAALLLRNWSDKKFSKHLGLVPVFPGAKYGLAQRHQYCSSIRAILVKRGALKVTLF